MTNAQAAEILRQYNAWRRGNDDEMPDAPVNPTRLGKAIDHAVAHLTQPAQAVDGWQPTDDDVQAWRGRHNISLSLYDCRSAIEDARIMHHFDVRPAALPNANGKEG